MDRLSSSSPAARHSRKEALLLFVRAQISSQIATFADFLISILLNRWWNVYFLYATMVGTVTGGIVNCGINYKWTFRNSDTRLKYIIMKYIIVWLGSLLMNIGLTYIITEWFTTLPYLNGQQNAFIIAKVIVSVTVAIGWNYTLQKNFVFKNVFSK